MRLSRDRSARACLSSMRLSRSRLTRACVYPGVYPGWPKHASIPGRLTRACVYSGVGWPKPSIPGSVGLSMRLACVYPGAVDPSMRLSRSRLTRACVYPGRLACVYASIPGSAGPSMRLSRDRSAQACVYPEEPARACVYLGAGWPKHVKRHPLLRTWETPTFTHRACSLGGWLRVCRGGRVCGRGSFRFGVRGRVGSGATGAAPHPEPKRALGREGV